MDCNRAEKLLVGYLYQELSPAETVRIEKHLESCSRCARTLENWKAIHLGFQRTVEEPPSAPYLKEKILATARQELGRKNTFFENFYLILKPALILPVMLFAALAVFLIFQRNTQMAQAPKPQPAAVQETAPSSRLDPDTENKLRSLGYVGEDQQAGSRSAKEVSKPSLSRDRNELADSMEARKQDEGRENDVAVQQYDLKAKTETLSKDRPSAPEPSYVQEKETISPPVAASPVPAQPPAPAEEGKGMEVKNAAFKKAQVYFERNDLNKGKTEAEQAIVQDKTGSLAAEFHEAGKKYQSNKEPEQAIVQYNLVLNNYPYYEQSPDVILRLAEAYEQIGAYDKALNSYQQLRQYPALKNTADQKIGEMMKKRKAQEQLRSLGYVDKQ